MTLLAALTVKVSAILLLALMGALCLRRRSAAVRHWVLAVGVVAAAAAPALHVLPVLPAVEVAPTGAGVLGPAVASEAVAAVARGDVAGRLVVTIWLLGAVASGAVLLVGLARLRWLRASSSRVTDGPWHRLCVDLARSCGLKRGADLLFGPLPSLVATWGWRRPAVLLPAAASAWSAERMRVVLLHELAHARRGDWTLQMAAEALRCVWWFNPLAWMVRARLRRESEHAADDLVLAQGVPATTCATHLVELARDVRKHRRTWLPAPAMARPSHLERRLSAMLNPRTNRRPMTRLARVGSLGVLVLSRCRRWQPAAWRARSSRSRRRSLRISRPASSLRRYRTAVRRAIDVEQLADDGRRPRRAAAARRSTQLRRRAQRPGEWHPTASS